MRTVEPKWGHVIAAFTAYISLFVGLVHGADVARMVLMLEGCVFLLILFIKAFKQAWDNGSVRKP